MQENTKTSITNAEGILCDCFGTATKIKIRKRENMFVKVAEINIGEKKNKFGDAKGAIRGQQLTDRHNNDQRGKTHK